MENLDENIAKQIELSNTIRKWVVNFKKDPASRKTEEYISKKESDLLRLWNEFKEREKEIAQYTIPEEHPYYKQNTSSETGYIVKEASELINYLKAELNKAKAVPVPSTSRTAESKGQSSTDAKHASKEHRYKRQNIKMRLMYSTIRDARNLASTGGKHIITEKISQLKSQMTAITLIHEDILCDADDDEESSNVYHTEKHFEALCTQYEAILCELSEASVYEDIAGVPNNLDVKLPPIHIPSFDGEFNKWMAFHGLFKKLIHENRRLTNVHRMHYLKTNLKGNAAKLIAHLNITDEDYLAAWRIVTDRYHNKRLLVTNYLTILMALPSANQESANFLRTLHDTLRECLHALNNLEVDTSTWDSILSIIILKKVDCETHRLYEASLKNPREIQSAEELLKFIESRFHALETSKQPRNTKERDTKSPGIQAIKSMHVSSTVCTKCHGPHFLSQCPKFKNLSSKDRSRFAIKNNMCFNCLSSKHLLNDCKSVFRCRICKGKHHTELHDEKSTTPPVGSTVAVNKKQSLHAYNDNKGIASTLLSTAIIKANSNVGHTQFIRALIDTGSQASFITESATQLLNLTKSKVKIDILGVGGLNAGTVRSKVTLNITSRYPTNFSTSINALVLPKLTQILPENPQNIQAQQWNEILLADPDFGTPGPIDIILGADVFPSIILDGVIKSPSGGPVAQRTELGWIISGPTANSNLNQHCVSMVIRNDVDEQLKRFWEIEEIPTNRNQTYEEAICEEFYQKSHRRQKDGRYTVRIPFKGSYNPSDALGNSRSLAVARFLQVERRLMKDPEIRKQYNLFMSEYIQLNHMKEVIIHNENKDLASYYMPHHPVLKESSLTTKLRVVFDASAKTSSGLSLNDLMLVGPTLQSDLTSIVLRWRKHKYVYTADIEKMFRQINVDAADQKYQCILWRQHPDEDIKTYKLTTVTYGTASASYLAIKTTQQLADDEGHKYPNAARIIKQDFYVDDLLSGADTLENAIEIQNQLLRILQAGGFNLRKWTSNHPDLTKNLPDESKTLESLQIKLDDSIKTLGISWNPKTDMFEFKVDLPKNQRICTKRTLLSEISKLFDPLGWLAPTIIYGKLLLQELWIAGLSWDQELPSELQTKWIEYRNSLCDLEQIKIPRWVQHRTDHHSELHGFCDASENAYAAAVYLKTVDRAGNAIVTLLTAKTKVAPVKSKVTLPRLELLGAVLLSKLLRIVQNTLHIEAIKTYGWTDSTIVLSWIKGNPMRFKTFVANRISEIQLLTQSSQWNHVKSEHNPADCASRGIFPRLLLHHPLWWNGPYWLQEPMDTWPMELPYIPNDEMLEQKQNIMVHVTTYDSDGFASLFKRFSNISKIQRVIAYAKRFINNALKRKNAERKSYITVEENQIALEIIIKRVQQEGYDKEIKELSKSNMANNSSKILALNPFLDDAGLLRVGGRLNNADLPYFERHPLILPPKHIITQRIIEAAHKQSLHGGTQLTLAYIRRNYWIINGRNTVQNVIRNCIRCRRYNSQTTTQLMGNLPQHRVTPSRPFKRCGVDYAGPINIRTSKGRGQKSYKGYLAIFVCLATKAIHIEVVSDQTTDAFLAAFKRFCSRRGLVSDMYSDNGTNFVGANSVITRERQNCIAEWNETISEQLSKDYTTWHFIPPAASHFGGIWEAGVKSVKYHLKRVIGDNTLTYEELSTVVTQIEACLNSRPLMAMNNDPTDLEVLTPGHFLIGEPLTSVPTRNLNDDNHNSLTRWKLLERMRQDFWKKWSAEYLHTLQQRQKWRTTQANLAIDDVVLLKDDRLPPAKWSLARITEVHPGADNQIRVVTVINPEGKLVKRPISKVIPLPIQDELDGPTTPKKVHSIFVHHWMTEFAKPPLLIMLLTTLLTMVSSMQSFQLKQFSHQVGIYFEDVGNVRFQHNEWNLIIHYNLLYYEETMASLQELTSDLSKACKGDVVCRTIEHECQHLMLNVKTADLLLQSSNKDHHVSKRGLINGVGYIANELFGVLDERSAIKYENQIKGLQSNQLHLLELAKNHTSISDASVRLFSENTGYMRKQLASLKTSVRQQEAKSTYQGIATQLTLSLMRVQETQRKLLDIILDTHHGKFNPYLLPPAELVKELNIIRSHIPTGVTLPDITAGKLTNIYNLMSVKARITQNNIIFSVKIPLPDTELYQTFRLIPLPISFKNEAVLIIPSSPYLIINAHRDRYYPLSETEFKQCFQTSENIHLCKPHNPIYDSQSNQSKCEVALLKHEDDSYHTCEMRSKPKLKLWIQLLKQNSWIYATNEEVSIDVICHSQIINSTIINFQGIVQLKSGCSIKQNGLTVIAQDTVKSIFDYSFLPSANIEKALAALKQREVKDDTLNFTNFHDKLESLRELIKQQRLQEETPLLATNHDIHHYTMIYLVIFTGIIVCTYFIIYHRKQAGDYHGRTKPAPAPRSLCTQSTSGPGACLGTT